PPGCLPATTTLLPPSCYTAASLEQPRESPRAPSPPRARESRPPPPRETGPRCARSTSPPGPHPDCGLWIADCGLCPGGPVSERPSIAIPQSTIRNPQSVLHAASSTATVSTCAVCGNRSNDRTAASP